MTDLLRHVEESILSRKLLARGEALLVAASGGVDSMVLLQVLHELSARFAWKLIVAHINHRLRGGCSDDDERFVVRTAKQLGHRVVTRAFNVREAARRSKLSIEMAARKLRHEFLARTAAQLNIQTVVLAQHADDQVELFFLRLLRGGGNEGLAGMKWRNPSPFDPKIALVRPFLDVPKSELREYAFDRGIRFREDRSNRSLDIQRNRVRHELLPLLRLKYQPAIDRAILRTMDIAGAEAEFVGVAAVRWLEARRRIAFSRLAAAVQRRCIQIQLRRRKLKADFDLVERLRTRIGNSTKVSPELAVKLDTSGELVLLESRPLAGPNPARRSVRLRGRTGDIVFDDVSFKWRIHSRKAALLPKLNAGFECFDADQIGSKIVLRHWRPGDRFQPIGMKWDVKLQDLFTNAKIPRHRRPNLVVAEAQDGSLFWVERLRISERFKVADKTIRRLHWQWKPL